MATMTLTHVSDQAVDRASSLALVCAPAHASMTTIPATTTNLWLGGTAGNQSFGSKYATKRITPGRLEGMT